MIDLPDPVMDPPCPNPDSGTTAALVRWAKAYARKQVMAERERWTEAVMRELDSNGQAHAIVSQCAEA